MARTRQKEPPKPPPTAASCLAAIMVVGSVIVALIGLWLLYDRVVAPLLPKRIVPNPEVHTGVGQELTFVELQSLTGYSPRVTAADLRHHVVLLHFWGWWCRPCRSELPYMAELQKRFAGREAFRLLAISCPPMGHANDLESLREETMSLLQRLDIDLPTYYDPDDMTRAAVDQLIEFEGFPTSVLLDRRGVIRAVWVGYRPGVETEIEKYVDQVLGETDGKEKR
jgi:cytochrome c biogenesis protein CcmG, thiol:disulfide interchange protein DsbE